MVSKTTDAQKRATRKYNDANTRQVKFGFSLKYDADILEKLDSVPNKQGYIKALIRADIAASGVTAPALKEPVSTQTAASLDYHAATPRSTAYMDHDPGRVTFARPGATARKISLDGGKNLLTAQDAMPEIIARNIWTAILSKMEPAARNLVATNDSPQTESEFLAAYLVRAKSDLIIS